MFKKIFYPIFSLSAILLLLACDTPPETAGPGIAGRIFHANLSDSTLILYSVVSKEYTTYSSSRNSSETISYEVAQMTALKLNGEDIQMLYQATPPCAEQSCGVHYIDKILAMGSHYWVLGCHCKSNFSVVDLSNGKQVFDTEQAVTRYPELKIGISEWESGEDATTLTISTNDGKKHSLSMSDLSLQPFAFGEFNPSCMNGEIPDVMQDAKIEKQWYYFDKNIEDNQSFLVARSTNSGTSQSRLYRTGEAWLCPGFLPHPQKCAPFIHNEHLFVLHASKWNEYNERDLLTMIDKKGERKFQIALDSLGFAGARRWMLAHGNYLYTVGDKEISITSLESGKVVRRIGHGSW